MAVRVENEGAVVIWVVVRPDSRLPVVLAARGDCRFVKSPDGRVIARRKGDVRAGLRGLSYSDTEEGLGTNAVPGEACAFRVEPRDPQRGQRKIIECLRSGDVANADGDVIQHSASVVSSSPAACSSPA